MNDETFYDVLEGGVMMLLLVFAVIFLFAFA